MGKYDDLVAGLPPLKGQSSGKYDDLLSGLPPVRENAESIEPGVYGETDPTGQKILENLGVAAGGYGMGQLAGGIAKGISKAAGSDFGQALIRSPKNLGADYAAQDAAVGVERTIPETSTKAVFEDPYKYPSQLSKPKYVDVKSTQPQIVNPAGKVISPNPSSSIEPTDVGPVTFSRPKPQIPAEPLPTTIPEKIPAGFAGFKKFADSRIDKFGDALTPQELMNYKVHLETKMADGSIPKYSDQGKITTIYQQASALRSKIANTFKSAMDSQLEGKSLPEGVIPTRTRLDRVNTISNRTRELPGKVYEGAKKYGKRGLIAATLAGALGAGYKYLGE